MSNPTKKLPLPSTKKEKLTDIIEFQRKNKRSIKKPCPFPIAPLLKKARYIFFTRLQSFNIVF